VTPQRLNELLGNFRHARIGVIGDFCVDSYYIVDTGASEPSLETGIPTRPVREQRSTLGGAGNVAANLHAIGAANLRAFAVVGPDSIGFELMRLLTKLGVDSSGVILQEAGWQTHSYLKPIVDGEEANRFDFGRFNVLTPQSASSLLSAMEAALPALDVLVINQQFDKGIHSKAVQSGLNALLARNPRVIALVDCRQLGHAYPSGWRKLNDLEATRLCGIAHTPGSNIPRQEAIDSAIKLYGQWRNPVFVTRGRNGCLVVDELGAHEIPGLHIIKKTDTVGAGDSMVAGIAACLAVGASPSEAATFGNFVAGVTVQKLQQTGTASPAEVLRIGEYSDYVYQPELAEDLRRASYLPGTEIEIVEPLPDDFDVRFAIFDHDGTISTLRQGWDEVMEPMMVRAILGPSFETADRASRERILRQSRDFIDKTTGIQTLQQMHGLSEMVREEGFVPESEILDAHGYKRIYNEALIRVVRVREERLRSGELSPEDFTIRNAVELLQRLHAAGVRLYLTSGTDERDVIKEAEALGYAPLFEGRIHGANQDMTHNAKRMVLERILGEIGAGNAGHIVTFGDGPVEIRETRKRGGMAVGVASNEIQRFGLQREKRTRVIRAGAQVVVPDFAQLDALLALLRVGARSPV